MIVLVVVARLMARVLAVIAMLILMLVAMMAMMLEMLAPRKKTKARDTQPHDDTVRGGRRQLHCNPRSIQLTFTDSSRPLHTYQSTAAVQRDPLDLSSRDDDDHDYEDDYHDDDYDYDHEGRPQLRGRLRG